MCLSAFKCGVIFAFSRGVITPQLQALKYISITAPCVPTRLLRRARGLSRYYLQSVTMHSPSRHSSELLRTNQPAIAQLSNQPLKAC